MCSIRAAVCGYCSGVKQAVNAVDAQLRAHPRGAVYTMGPLIHNPQVLSDLAERGVQMLSESALPKDLSGAVVVIRAHGISPQLKAALEARHAEIVDATCPKVRANQKKAQQLTQEGYKIFLAGEQNHGEIKALKGYAPGCIVVPDPKQARKAGARLAQEEPDAATVLLGQTTISPAEYQDIAGALIPYFPDIWRVDTICPATQQRQEAVRALCATVDAVIVIGGRESANTHRLVVLAHDAGKPAWLVESVADIPSALAGYTRVGIGAGASTPDELIATIEKHIQAL
ncbi:MAG: 4-hydroxy-3-methylbut-2-enyl diphosphate reductase [Spirochaetaceae bacterium]|jgi:4-hydroxy-3-methylbut-2-enyl diphosphate reductase|nr:4-hydroxy-3-methylbut-2-enyl diphosphate reductase [Spirochaetaceae bacterium]